MSSEVPFLPQALFLAVPYISAGMFTVRVHLGSQVTVTPVASHAAPVQRQSPHRVSGLQFAQEVGSALHVAVFL